MPGFLFEIDVTSIHRVPLAAIFVRRSSEPSATTSVEVEDLVEAANVGDFAHLDIVMLSTGEHGARLLQSQFQNAFGEVRSRFVQELLNVVRRTTQLQPDIVCRKGRIGKSLDR